MSAKRAIELIIDAVERVAESLDMIEDAERASIFSNLKVARDKLEEAATKTTNSSGGGAPTSNSAAWKADTSEEVSETQDLIAKIQDVRAELNEWEADQFLKCCDSMDNWGSVSKKRLNWLRRLWEEKGFNKVGSEKPYEDDSSPPF